MVLKRQIARVENKRESTLCAVLAIVIVLAALLSGCGGTSGSNQQSNGAVSGNWQLTFSPPTTNGSFVGGLQSGFLLQSGNSVTGSLIYSVSVLNSQTGPCNSGVAGVTGTVSGQNVTLTVAAGSQTFTLAGQLSSSGLSGTYTSTAGTAVDGSACGSAISSPGLSWSAVSVPALTGSVQWSFHSTGGVSSLDNQDFQVTGFLTQSANIGASNATVTGSLSFTGYPCISSASVNGEISGSTVILQLISSNGTTVGQIGAATDSPTSIFPVSFESAQGGYILHGTPMLGPGYIVASSGCPGTLENTAEAGDVGNVCLSLNSVSPCQQPITLTPASLSFPAQMLGSPLTSQTITLTNNSSTALTGLTLKFAPDSDGQFFYGQNDQTDFNGLPSFTEVDACGPGGSAAGTNPFDLSSGQACSITITFSPQEACPWLPFVPSGAPGPSILGAPPQNCPLAQVPTLTATLGSSSSSADGNTSFAASISGTGLSAIQPSTPELDFGAENAVNPAEASLPQQLLFTNYSNESIQILGSEPCTNPARQGAPKTFPHDPISGVAGLQVVPNNNPTFVSITPDLSTIQYDCDVDPDTLLANFQISSDTCSGATLAPQNSCSIQIAYVPQPNTDIDGGLDFFLQLNTVQCFGAVTTGCEIDSGRFPVELRANGIGPLRMSPSAGLDFGTVAKGSTTAPMTVTLLNDPDLPNPQSVTFQGRFVVSGNYAESDDCQAVLEVGASCTLSLTFTPTGTGLETGKVQIYYASQANNPGAIIYLRGTGH